MTVTVVYHALLREKAGREREQFELPAPADVRAAIAAAASAHPGLAALAGILKAAVNEEMAAPETGLREGDRVDLLPPFGGG